ncbi:hypothetical protein M441DRAFT_129504 [Trichoderma asperellum CBS 433.97]|uniref:Xylanolytic transcriptional activator regulatory domain-containing protein n=1 Tax=Trichoderma asperellum (strain ATCC 204424 / CBS 433.97 / NBRC 101777) TaxID=1042311 RepID=A0A2T3ZJ48_TRIA4|nr:hypothetical protein M441DRAFT_129504 [Trichoderma asperellum CBS 433.97]PTB44834.1 hypothetical protein M441DRAFT_129504 [Trichoderma asperellum CBS 433.97]
MEFSSRKIEKRNRPPVSCEPCRPCEGCSKRGQAASCRYAPNAIRNKPRTPKVNIQERLDNLESMLSSMVSTTSPAGLGSGNHEQPASSSSTSRVSTSYQKYELSVTSTSNSQEDHVLPPELPHRHETGDGQVSYVDPSHWMAILDEIKEVREHLSAFDRPLLQEEPGHKNHLPEEGVGFLFSTFPVVDIQEVLTSLPPRQTCDALVSQYFNSRFMALGILHPAKFQKEYEKFWEAPVKAPPLWISLLFSILSMSTALRLLASASESNATPVSLQTLRQRAIECLMLGKFATANSYSLEILIIHMQCSFLAHHKLNSDHWFEMGTLIRLAFRMGYHHDPDNLPGISVFDGEMRRRVWHNLVQVDALMSFQMGLPSMIATEFCDTKVPRNLQFSDLEMGMTTLPPGRPLSENTPIRYPIAKAGIMAVFKKIVAHSLSLSLPTYDNTIVLDNELREAYSALPDILKARDMLKLKGLIVLHRRFILSEVDSHRVEHSRRACAEAALDILARQADIHQASQPGGRLYDDRWMISSLTVHDFLLAAMVICLHLSVCLRRTSSNPLAPRKTDGGLAEREYRALEKSQQIWASDSSTSSEARIAALALDLMVQKIAVKDADHVCRNEPPRKDPIPNNPPEDLFPFAGTMSQMIDGTEGLDWVS